jgi:hypothetical protein
MYYSSITSMALLKNRLRRKICGVLHQTVMVEPKTFHMGISAITMNVARILWLKD